MTRLMILAVAVLGGSALAQCTKDVECKGDRVCVQGVCTAPEATTQPTAPPIIQGERSARLLDEQDTVATRASLLAEKEKLLTARPSTGWNVFGIVISSVGLAASVVSFVFCVAFSVISFAVVFGVTFAINLAVLIVNAYFFAKHIGDQARTDNRVREIDRQLQTASNLIEPVPPQVVVLRF